jgi:hypothetical protein
MTRQGRSQLVLGLILILLGAWFVAQNMVPSLAEFTDTYFQGPFILVWIGAGLLLLGLLTSNPGMAVPAAIVAGVGGIIWYNETYASQGQGAWAYMWTLIIGFVGVGSILAGLLGDNPRQNISRGLNSIVVSAVLFLVFATFFGGLSILGEYGLPIVLILLGLWFLGRSVWKSMRRGDDNA